MDIKQKTLQISQHCRAKINYKKVGRPRTTLPIMLNKDIEYILNLLPCQLKKEKDIQKLEKLENDRKFWQSIVADMCV